MVVCRYFLQGCCKFGDHCRYQHYQERNANQIVGYRGHSRSWHAPGHVQQGRTNSSGSTYQPPNASGSINPLDLAEAIKEDVIAMEEGGQWPLSSYTPSKDFGSFPGFHDMSMEEVRYEAYQAQVSGTFDQYVKKIENLIQATRMKWGMLKNPTGQVMSVIEKMASGQGMVGENPSSGLSSFSFTASFNSAAQQQQSGFSLGGHMAFAAPQSGGNIFAEGVSTGASSVAASNFRFALMPQPASNTPFGTPATHPNSPTGFGGSPVYGQSAGLLFGSSTPASSHIPSSDLQQQVSPGFFGVQQGAEKQVSAFGVAPARATGSTVLGSSASSYETNAFQTKTVAMQQQYSTLGIYTPLSDLTEVERKDFTAMTFNLGSIPLKPPPSELCL